MIFQEGYMDIAIDLLSEMRLLIEHCKAARQGVTDV